MECCRRGTTATVVPDLLLQKAVWLVLLADTIPTQHGQHKAPFVAMRLPRELGEGRSQFVSQLHFPMCPPCNSCAIPTRDKYLRVLPGELVTLRRKLVRGIQCLLRSFFYGPL